MDRDLHLLWQREWARATGESAKIDREEQLHHTPEAPGLYSHARRAALALRRGDLGWVNSLSITWGHHKTLMTTICRCLDGSTRESSTSPSTRSSLWQRRATVTITSRPERYAAAPPESLPMPSLAQPNPSSTRHAAVNWEGAVRVLSSCGRGQRQRGGDKGGER